jgi:hypothetical protein
MPLTSKYLFVASMDVDPDKQALLEDVYDADHIPHIASVTGVRSVTRFRRRELTLMIGGARKTIELESEPRSTVLYEIESPDVLLSDEWAEKVELGRWSSEVRPFTKNRRLVLLERVGVSRTRS